LGYRGLRKKTVLKGTVMGKVVERIREKGVLVSDGAWGTFLHQKGLKADKCPESWNLSFPEKVRIAQSYVEAGADIILTNRFRGQSRSNWKPMD
jgi:5-methyltetrahydrofolate--homocysteine methyltransferase